jgi:hypothetical protein
MRRSAPLPGAVATAATFARSNPALRSSASSAATSARSASVVVRKQRQRRALPWIVRLKFELPVTASEPLADDEELPVETQEWFEQFKEQLRSDGILQAFIGLFEERLERSLSDAERATVRQHLDHLGEARVRRAVLTLSADELSRWLIEPVAT